MRIWIYPALCGLALVQAGCPFFGPWGDDDWDDDSSWRDTERSAAPSVDAIELQDWPPLGPDDVVEVSVSDDVALSWLSFGFRDEVGRPLSGTSATEQVIGAELGEGFGTLRVQVDDTHGGYAIRRVEDLLVDLSPPEITLGKTILPATGGIFEAWIADAWVLGGYELEVGAAIVDHQFEPGYPPTLGEAWDYSLVRVPTIALPTGASEARLTAWDAAGNRVSASFELTIDGVPPELAILSPLPQTAVSGPFQVELVAADAGGGPVAVELLLGGTVVATAVGPSATVELDASEFAAGPLDLAAVAQDEAGNESDPFIVPLLVD